MTSFSLRTAIRGVSSILRSDPRVLAFLTRNQRLLSSTAQEEPQSQPEGEHAAEEKVDDSRNSAAIEEAPEYLKLLDEKEKLSKDLNDAKDKYMRALAETENTRVRLQKQIADAKEFGIQGFCKDLLEVADILSTAVDSVSRQQLKAEADGSALTSLHQGVAMTQQQLRVVFARRGIQVIDPGQGEKFDPNVHEALFQAPEQDGCPPGSVAIVQKVGYALKTRTLRPALVGVVKQ